MTDEHIVMTVRDQYSTITSNTKNLLLDTNAPTLDPVDAVDQTRTITGNGTWGAVSSSPGFKISYGGIISASYSDTIVSWVGKDDFESCTLEVGKKYTISYYYNVHNKTGSNSTRVYFRTIVEYENGDTQSDTKGATTNTNKWISAKYTFTAQSDAAVIKFRVNTSNGITADVELAGFMLTETEDAIDWNDGVHIPGDFVTTEVMESTIEQSADAIRLKADKIAWQSTGSTMSEEGHFECTDGLIGGIHISNDGLYYDEKTSYDSSNAGFFFGADGTFGVGDGTSYLRYDDSGNLKIKANKLSWSATNSSMTEDGTMEISGAKITSRSIDESGLYGGYADVVFEKGKLVGTFSGDRRTAYISFANPYSGYSSPGLDIGADDITISADYSFSVSGKTMIIEHTGTHDIGNPDLDPDDIDPLQIQSDGSISILTDYLYTANETGTWTGLYKGFSGWKRIGDTDFLFINGLFIH